MNSRDEISILVCSHSKADDLWTITGHFLHKYCQDCPYQIYLGANGDNKKEQCPDQWIYINQGEDMSWSQSMISYLSVIPTTYVLLWLDDFILLSNVKSALIKKASAFIQNYHPMMLRLTPNPKGTLPFDASFDRIDVHRKVPYATSLQVSIWNKNFLLSLLRYGFSPWDFEIKAGKVSESLQQSNHLYVASTSLLHYTHYVEKGKFYPFIHELISKENIVLNSSRLTLTPKELTMIRKTRWYSHLLHKILPQYTNPIRRIFRKHEL
jgi:hypothetical protein